MCNACGFFCCAYDGFSKCGCDHCPNPACWDDDADEFEAYDDYIRFFCDSPDAPRPVTPPESTR